MDNLLKELAADPNGVITLRDPMGAAGEPHRRRRRDAEKLVQRGYAKWGNPQRTVLRITNSGRRYLNR